MATILQQIICVSCALLVIVSGYSRVDLKNIQGMNITCLNDWCKAEMADCMLDADCRKNMECSAVCMANWDKDPTPGKIHAQNCTTKCGVSYENAIIDNIMTCLMSHKCITFPPTNVSCPAGLEAFIEPTSSLANLKGEWWQHLGYNQLWDCYPCQHIHDMHLVNDSDWAYTYSYELFTVDDKLKYFQQTWQLPNPPQGKVINITYMYLGTLHNESWYILKATPRYVVLVDCSYMFTWTNVGSILWVRPEVVLNTTEMTVISETYKKALGWNFPTDFCVDRHGADNCPSNSNVALPASISQPPSRSKRIHMT